MLRRIAITVLLVCGALPAWAQPPAPVSPASPPPLLLANVYRAGLPLADYWVSEKYDGVRGYWDGHQLHTRGGERVNAPAWFTQGWPAIPMDGELWAGRGRFAQAQSTVRQQRPDDAAWRHLQFMVFDLPAQGGPFDERLPALQTAVARIGHPWVQAVPQQRIATDARLQALLHRTVRDGGEGLMLHRGASLYQAGRSDDLIKLKTHEDTEARVVGYVPGKGRHRGRMGALLVEMPGGQRFRLGAGFTDADRAHPPPLGSWVTYRFRGTHEGGLPRFASFLRVREDMHAAAP
ncbi:MULTISPECIES: DNA ligase [unclassified Acidovorax]|uniref:DNA ligase n=1 Tax=unclassified Acidovorax TaxID=2684926 RepID=UPI00234A8BBB|nr:MULTISPECIES: DNA ligase [unclassified Acidovorax]WCM95641.1 DNA ligase [Acidovorax sp. GBBC 1281]GKS95945.1 DNA ligase [Acidovorax sp. SUPP2825]GKT17575.1 DNA ligase [Acidovorax sp. SUPP2522]